MGADSSPQKIFAVLAEKYQRSSNSEASYKLFLVKNENDILHNIAESIKSVNEKLEYEEDIAWQAYQELNKIAPPDDEDEEVVQYRQSIITALYMGLAATTKALTERKLELEKLRREVCGAVNKIKRQVKERRKQPRH